MLNKAQIIDRITSRVETLDPQKVTKSIVLYRLVRHLFDQNPNVEENIEFRWAYAAFYGLNHYKRSDLPTYFQVLHLHYLLKDSSMDINEIVKELKTKKQHYVFASKLMNFVDDSRYPIIDRHISKVFSFSTLDTYSDRYDCVKEVYVELSTREDIKQVISQYDFGKIGMMKVLDIIVWNINL